MGQVGPAVARAGEWRTADLYEPGRVLSPSTRAADTNSRRGWGRRENTQRVSWWHRGIESHAELEMEKVTKAVRQAQLEPWQNHLTDLMPPQDETRMEQGQRRTKELLEGCTPSLPCPSPPPCPPAPPPQWGGTVTWPTNNKKSIGNHNRRPWGGDGHGAGGGGVRNSQAEDPQHSTSQVSSNSCGTKHHQSLLCHGGRHRWHCRLSCVHSANLGRKTSLARGDPLQPGPLRPPTSPLLCAVQQSPLLLPSSPLLPLFASGTDTCTSLFLFADGSRIIRSCLNALATGRMTMEEALHQKLGYVSLKYAKPCGVIRGQGWPTLRGREGVGRGGWGGSVCPSETFGGWVFQPLRCGPFSCTKTHFDHFPALKVISTIFTPAWSVGGRTVRCARAVHALCARCAKSWLFSTTGSSVSSED